MKTAQRPDDAMPWILTGYGAAVEIDPTAARVLADAAEMDFDLFGCGLLAGFPLDDTILITSASPVPPDSLRLTTGIEPGHEGIPEWMVSLGPHEDAPNVLGAWAYCPSAATISEAWKMVVPLDPVRSVRVGLIVIGPGVSDLECWLTTPRTEPVRLGFDAARSIARRIPPIRSEP